ncbi:MAG: glycosyltransferase, partial [Candidatus Zophobacter franzmannii]|nr:glycosyltransferase [Candidatus Zophobacter franzmannii]
NVTFLPFISKLKKILSCKVYLETHDFFTDLTLRTDINTSKKLRQQRFERKYIPTLDGVFCLMDSQIELYRQYYPNTRFILARTGLTKFRVDKKRNERDSLGYIGSLDIHKGVRNIFSIASMTKTKPPVIVIGAKSKAEKERFIEEASKLYDSSKVSVYLWQDKKSLLELMNRMKLGFVTLEDTFFNQYLTSPLKLFDYYSKQIPVVGTKIGTLSELVRDGSTGYLYSIGSEKEIAEKIDKLYSDDELYASIQDNIDKFCDELTWDVRAKVIAEEISKSN